MRKYTELDSNTEADIPGSSFGGMFFYFWFPNYIAPFLSYFSWWVMTLFVDGRH